MARLSAVGPASRRMTAKTEFIAVPARPALGPGSLCRGAGKASSGAWVSASSAPEFIHAASAVFPVDLSDRNWPTV